jgi:hypothetical protein
MFDTFNEVKDTALRTHNRLAMFTNLLEQNGQNVAVEYLNKIDEVGRGQMVYMKKLHRVFGKEDVTRRVIMNTIPEEEGAVD